MSKINEAFDAKLRSLKPLVAGQWWDSYRERRDSGATVAEAKVAAWHTVGVKNIKAPGGVLYVEDLLYQRKDDWEESLHPRAADGKFGEGGGAVGGGAPKHSGTASVSSGFTSQGSGRAAKPGVPKSPKPGKPTPTQQRSNNANGGKGLEVHERQAILDAQQGKPVDKALHDSVAEKLGVKDLKTADIYITPNTWALRKPDGSWPEDRARMHAAWVADRRAGVPKATGPVTLYTTGGGPASGKTTALLEQGAAGIPKRDAVVYVGADEAKNMIPEYRMGIERGDDGAAGAVHWESGHMADTALAESFAAGQHVALDTVGDSGIETLSKRMEGYRSQEGRPGVDRIVANYVTLEPTIAVDRAVQRGKDSGRVIPQEVLHATHADVNRTGLAAMHNDLFDEMTVWDNNVPFGSPPIKVLSKSRNGDVTVHNPELYMQYRARAK